MEEVARPRRELKKRVGETQRKDLEKLRALREAKRAGESHHSVAASFELRDAERIYDEVDEKEYKEIVAQRQAKGQFVVGGDNSDDEDGYSDDGQEYCFEDEAEQKNQKNSVSGASGRNNSDARRKRNQRQKEAVIPGAKITSLLISRGACATGGGEDQSRMGAGLGIAEQSIRANSLFGNGEGAQTSSKKKTEGVDDQTFNQLLQQMENQIQESGKRRRKGKKKDGKKKKLKKERREHTQPIYGVSGNGTGARRIVAPSIKQEQSDDIAHNVFDTNDNTGLSNAPITYEYDYDEEDTPAPVQQETTELDVKPVIDNESSEFAASNSPPSAVDKKRTFQVPEYKFKDCEVEDIHSSQEEYKQVSTVAEDAVKALSEGGKDFVGFYFLDAYEVPQQPGQVYVFGKVMREKAYESCCLIVTNIKRQVFLQPLDEKHKCITELRQELKKIGINTFRSYEVQLRHCFDEEFRPDDQGEAPLQTFLRIEFEATVKTLPTTLQHSKLFGSQQSSLERFLLAKKIMGPDWYKLSHISPVDLNSSWCVWQMSMDMDNGSFVQWTDSPPATPPLRVLSLKITPWMNETTQVNEIVLVTGFNFEVDGDTGKMKSVVRPISYVRRLREAEPQNSDPITNRALQVASRGIQKASQSTVYDKPPTLFEKEADLLKALLNIIKALDPDVLVGHNFLGYDLDILLHRLKCVNSSDWSVIGRLRRKNMPKLQSGAGGMHDATWEEKFATAGRLVCDTYLNAKNLVKDTSYSLPELAKRHLGQKDVEGLDASSVKGCMGSAEKIVHLSRHSQYLTYLSSELMMKLDVLPLTKQLTNCSGNLWSSTLTGGRAERVEYLLLHEFYNKQYILPEKKKVVVDQSKSRRKKAAYKGGLVLEPKANFYGKYVLLLDFNSLYPSIIREYNICFTTIPRILNSPAEELESTKLSSQESGKAASVRQYVQAEKDRKGETEQVGPLPTVISNLVERRKVVKNLMENTRDEEERKKLNIRQLALKLIANSMYGCLGFSYSRFYAMPLAELVTRKGRDALEAAVRCAKDIGLDVIYGDTDSIMLYVPADTLAEAKKKAFELKKEINKKYTFLEIELDGVFLSMLLLKKKKYAALMLKNLNDDSPNPVTTQEMKGLDMVRRDWCPLSKEIGKTVLDIILSGKPQSTVVEEITDYLQKVGESIQLQDLTKFVITKSLNKAPDQYADAHSLPHVMVALRMKRNNIPVTTNQAIGYIICQGDSSAIAERAYSYDEVDNSHGLLVPDFEWYKTQQIHPPIVRLIDVIDGIDAFRVAQLLGMDESKFQRSMFATSSNTQDDQYFAPMTQMDAEDRYRDAEPLMFMCSKGHRSKFEGMFRRANGNKENEDDKKNVVRYELGVLCPVCSQRYQESWMMNQLKNSVNQCIAKYYEGYMICEEPTCRHRTRDLYFKRKPRCPNSECKKGIMKEEFDSEQLHKQLLYFRYITDVDRFTEQINKLDLNDGARDYVDHVRALHAELDLYLDLNARHFVNCKKLFSFFAV